MADRKLAKPGDIIMYRNKGFLGAAIAWSQWTGESREALEYSHIGQVFDHDNSAEMNPPCSRIFNMDLIDWPAVDLFRFKIGGMNPYDQAGNLARLQDICRKRVGIQYDYAFIGKALFVGLVARVGLRSYSQHLSHHIGGNGHREVCSTWVQTNNEHALQITDLFGKGDDQDSARPSDWPQQTWLERIS